MLFPYTVYVQTVVRKNRNEQPRVIIYLNLKAEIDSKSLNKQFVLSVSSKLSKMFAFGKYDHVHIFGGLWWGFSLMYVINNG